MTTLCVLAGLNKLKYRIPWKSQGLREQPESQTNTGYFVHKGATGVAPIDIS